MEILGIDVAYLHTSNGAELAEWFTETLGLNVVYSDEHWYSLTTKEGSDFGLDVTGFPRSAVEAHHLRGPPAPNHGSALRHRGRHWRSR